MAERPALYETEVRLRKNRGEGREERREGEKNATNMFPKLVIIRVLDFMKVVLVQLTHERRKIGVLEHAW